MHCTTQAHAHALKVSARNRERYFTTKHTFIEHFLLRKSPRQASKVCSRFSQSECNKKVVSPLFFPPSPLFHFLTATGQFAAGDCTIFGSDTFQTKMNNHKKHNCAQKANFVFKNQMSISLVPLTSLWQASQMATAVLFRYCPFCSISA